LSGITQVSRYQKGKTNLDFTEARDSEWQWHQPGHMQVCTLLQTDNHTSTPPVNFLQAGYPSCHPNNSIKALKATVRTANQQFKVYTINSVDNYMQYKLKRQIILTAGKSLIKLNARMYNSCCKMQSSQKCILSEWNY